MKTVGEILKETREAKFYSLEEIEKSTKIRKELLQALESDDYSKLPPPTFVQGFIKNYAKFLGLDSNKLLAIFRRGFEEKRHKPYIMSAFSNPLGKRQFKVTPGLVLGGVVCAIILSFFGYLWVQYHQFVGSPTLEVVSPQDQLATDDLTITVEGKTDPENKVAVNGQDVSVSGEGVFKEEIALSSPVNKVSIVATSKLGQKTEEERVVYLKR